MTSKIVKYHNDVHTVSLREFSAAELDIFVAILSSMRDTGENKVTFTFSEIKELIHWKAKNNERFLSLLKSTYDKLLKTHIRIGNDIDWTSFVLFTEYTVSGSTSKVTIAVNPKFRYILNLLLSNFTRFELDEFLSLKSTYAKEFYRRMKQFRNTGVWNVSLEEFKRVLDIPEKYKMTMIDLKVLAPIKNELGGKYRLEIIKQYDNTKRGRPSVCGFKFTFLKDSELNTSANAEVADVKRRSWSGNSEEATSQQAHTSQTSKKRERGDMEFNKGLYLMRTMRVRDKKFTRQQNFLKILDIDYDTERRELLVKVKNMDDDYINTIRFSSFRVWDNYFNEHVIN